MDGPTEGNQAAVRGHHGHKVSAADIGREHEFVETSRQGLGIDSQIDAGCGIPCTVQDAREAFITVHLYTEAVLRLGNGDSAPDSLDRHITRDRDLIARAVDAVTEFPAREE